MGLMNSYTVAQAGLYGNSTPHGPGSRDQPDKDFSLGLSFVAISRVKTLAGIAFWQLFGLGRLQKSMTESRKMLEDDMACRPC